MQYICEHRHIEMSEYYLRILVYMASAFGWPVRANGQCATYSKVLTIILYILFDLRRKTAKCLNANPVEAQGPVASSVYLYVYNPLFAPCGSFFQTA